MEVFLYKIGQNVANAKLPINERNTLKVIFKFLNDVIYRYDIIMTSTNVIFYTFLIKTKTVMLVFYLANANFYSTFIH